MAADKTLTCRDCGTDFVFTAGEQDFYAQKGFSGPSRCPACRAQRKMERLRTQADETGAPGGPASEGGGRGGRGQRDFGRDEFDRGGRGGGRDRGRRERW